MYPGIGQSRCASASPTSVSPSLEDRPLRQIGLLTHEHRQVGGHLVIARARRVELSADAPDDLRQPPLDRRVDVLVAVGHHERSVPELGLDLREPGQQLIALGL